MTKKKTIKDFHIKTVVEWSELERVFAKLEHKKFMNWMSGQGCYPEGVFPWDLERYLQSYQYLKVKKS